VADAVASIAADVVDEAVSRMDRTEAVSEEGAEETEEVVAALTAVVVEETVEAGADSGWVDVVPHAALLVAPLLMVSTASRALLLSMDNLNS